MIESFLTMSILCNFCARTSRMRAQSEGLPEALQGLGVPAGPPIQEGSFLI
jgi:hypothetical protein